MSAEWANLWASLGMWIVGGGVAALLALGYQLHGLALRLASLESFKSHHTRENEEAHKRLELEGKEIIAEVRLSRSESTEQHAALSQRVESLLKEGRDERRAMHAKIDEMNRSAATIKGWIAAQTGRQPDA